MSGAVRDFGPDVKKIFDEFVGCANILMTVKVFHKPAYADKQKHPALENDLSAYAKRCFK